MRGEKNKSPSSRSDTALMTFIGNRGSPFQPRACPPIILQPGTRAPASIDSILPRLILTFSLVNNPNPLGPGGCGWAGGFLDPVSLELTNFLAPTPPSP